MSCAYGSLEKSSYALQQAALTRAHQCIDVANQQLGTQLTYPVVGFTLRGKSAGTAHPTQWRVRFNPVLLQQAPEIFFDEVIPHEICHLVAFALHGRVKPHGAEWRHLMAQVFNAPANTTHQLDISAVQGKTFAYHCDCGPVALSIRRHNKIQRGQATYRCNRCQQQLARID
ncbi:SprT family zinc-dependent metalloprotease [Salinivibrio kushneri]|uniref:SprT family zinc-dependent metalloprotease n=1 Tax=Salinivibrio kushneri TaxID=1908198 RepID=A0AA47KJX8_9GAMM|nr:SprT family zinc-dependent metalloprotease [Salinivibrio kushneri]WBA08305.1 SprT family zinc-dependent metalloprotease [Salinivibrio kushneri]